MTQTEYPQASSGREMPGWRLGRAELLAIVGFWSFLGVLSATSRMLDPRFGNPSPGLFSPPVALALFEYLLWALLTPLVFWLVGRTGRDPVRWPVRTLILAVAGLVLAIFVDVAFDLFRLHALHIPMRRGADVSPILFTITRLWFINDLMVYVAVLATGIAREYFYRYRLRKDEAVRLQAHAAQLQAQLAEARLSALRMQINPHFLFNTLHAVSSLVERDPKGVRRMIARLSELLRHALDGTAEQEVPLERELEFLRRYMEIMQIRFQGRLEVEMNVEPSLLDAMVPNLILQPLVENAIKHGVSNTLDTGRIEIAARRDRADLVLTVRDDGPGMSGEVPNEGVGLRNTRARLEQLYGEEYALALRPAPGGGFLAEIRLPFHTLGDLRTAAMPESLHALHP